MTQTSIKIPKGSIMEPTALKVWPGSGAVDYAKQYLESMEPFHVLAVCNDMVSGYFEEYGDKRVRRCQFCGYYYKDITYNNSSLVCSEECKTGKDIALKAHRRKIKAISKPGRKTYKDKYYAEYTQDGELQEYPFWKSEFHMFEYDRKHGAYSHGDDFEDIIAWDMTVKRVGGRRSAVEVTEYDGEKKARNVAVKLSEKLRKTTEIVVYKMPREEMENYLLETYGADKLRQERRRSILFGKGVRG